MAFYKISDTKILARVDRGSAMRLGLDQYCSLKNPVSFNDIAMYGKFTWEVWVLPEAIGPGFSVRQDLFVVNDSSYPLYFWIAEYAGWRAHFIFSNNSGSHFVQSAEPLQARRWTHIAVTYDSQEAGDNLKMYINGEVSASAVAAGNFPAFGFRSFSNPYPWGRTDIGFLDGNVSIRKLTGQMDEWRIWNRALSQQEIQENMACSAALYNILNRTGLILWMGFDTIAVQSGDSLSGNQAFDSYTDRLDPSIIIRPLAGVNGLLPVRVGSTAPLKYRLLGLIGV